MTDELDPIAPEKARAILQAALREHLGEEWEDEENGWSKVTGHDYMTRVTRGRVNLDFYVDLLGSVKIEKSEISPVQESGRLLAWVFLLLSLGIAVMIARAVGWL
ncbi:MAG: hypothetical protein H7175_07435 [Burkholderiales bacterium]|nr:hypothetical protein [Anaerolineae bacterium]